MIVTLQNNSIKRGPNSQKMLSGILPLTDFRWKFPRSF